MSLRFKVKTLIVATVLVAAGALLLALAERPDDAGAARVSGWALIALLLLGVLGLVVLVGAMAYVIAAMMPDVLSAPDADELTRDARPADPQGRE